MALRGTSWQWQLVLIMVLVSGIALASFISVLSQLVRISNFKKLDAELVAVSLKYGRAFMVSTNPERRLNTDRDLYEEGSTFAETGFAVFNLSSNVSRTDDLWPSELDPAKLGKRILNIYKRQGMPFQDSRFFEMQRRISGTRQNPDDRVQELDRERREGPNLNIPPEIGGNSPQSIAPPNPNARPPDARPGRNPRQYLPSLDQSVFYTVEFEGNRYRVMGFTNGRGVFLAAQDLAYLAHDMKDLGRAILLALPVTLILIGLVAFYLARRAIGPVKRLTYSAAHITAEGLDNRLTPEREPPEFAKLIQVYNQMLDRLQASFHQARRFSADAAHELNTPLTILQGHLDILLQSAEVGSESQEQLALLCGEVSSLQEVIRKLLVLSQADAGKLAIEAKQTNFSLLVSEILEDAELMAPGLEVSGDIPSGIEVMGDRDLLRQSVFNLVSNAIKYNLEDGFIRIKMREVKDRVQLDVINAGPAIPSDKADKLFERFYRVDDARNSKIEGRGLGLSLAREFLKAHDGSLKLVLNVTDKITFRMELPA